MKIKSVLICIILLILSFSAKAEQKYIVKLNNDIQLFSTNQSFGDKFAEVGEEELEEYLEAGIVEYYEPSMPAYLLGNGNWQLDNINAYFPDKIGALGNEVKVGIIDSGMNVYPAIKDRVVKGKNFTPEDGDETIDTNGHGTFVGSMIALKGSGAAYQSIIVPLKCFYKATDNNGEECYTSNTYYITQAIIAAVDQFDCDVINMSLTCGTDKWSLRSLKEAVDYAVEKGVIVVAAAGNYGNEAKESVATAIHYPAGYDNVVGVGSTDKNNNHSVFSQRNNSVLVCAPGEDVIVTPNSNSVNRGSGTSFSAPMVSSAAAIAKSVNPKLTASQFINLLKITSTDLGEEGYDVLYGYGLLNCEALIRKMLEGYSLYISPAKIEDGKSSTTIFNNTKSEHTLLSAFVSSGDFSANQKLIASDEAWEVLSPFELKKSKFMLWEATKLRPLIPPLVR